MRLRYLAVAAAAGAVLLAARRPLMDRVTDMAARRPSGPIGRWIYRESAAHQGSFRATLDALALTPDDRLLELGCGGGVFLEQALARGCTATAIDHSSDMVSLARQRNRAAEADGRLEVRHADVAELPCGDEAFTAVASTNAFFFFDDPRAGLGEARRVLTPGGRIAVFTLAPGAPRSIAPPPFAKRMHCYSDDQMRQLFADAGFADVTVRRSGDGGHGQLITARRPPATGTAAVTAMTGEG
jgi:SAM-dependent methyltransferase